MTTAVNIHIHPKYLRRSKFCTSIKKPERESMQKNKDAITASLRNRAISSIYPEESKRFRIVESRPINTALAVARKPAKIAPIVSEEDSKPSFDGKVISLTANAITDINPTMYGYDCSNFLCIIHSQ